MKHSILCLLCVLVLLCSLGVFTVHAETISVPGDLDGNGSVTADDAIHLLMFSFFPEDYPVADTTVCDYNGDGIITCDDAIYLLMYTFFPNEYPLTPSEDIIPFKRGINLQGLDGAEYSSGWGNTAYLGKDETYTNIKNKGFDHVRFPVDLRRYYDSSKKALKSNMSNVDMILDKIEAAGLYCILDFHGWYNLNTSDATQKDTFLTIWELVAERYKNRSNKLCFELINEPHDTEGGNLNATNLNALQNEVIPIIRQTNPTRLILAAAAEWNGPWKLSSLNLPTDDGHIGVVCHTYAPLDFTHQGATWDGHSGDQVHFDPNNAAQTKDLRNAFTWIKQYRDRTGIPVILNEFGVCHVNSKMDHDEATTWLKYVTDRCTQNDVPWTYWEYNMSFGAYRNGNWVDFIMEGLGMN